MKKTIAVDVDDVLAAHAEGFVAFSNEQWGTNLTVDDYDEHWAKMWGVSNEETMSRARSFHDSRTVSRYSNLSGAKEVLQGLSNNYRLVITTSRRKELIEQTTEWIDRYYAEIFEEIHYAGLWDKVSSRSHLLTKAALCRQIGADYLIDDQLKHCLAAAESGITALLFGDYKWNRAARLPADVTRVRNWQEVKEYFDNER